MENSLAEKLGQRGVVQLLVDLLPDTDRELISDGYHSFKELYEHRVVLFIALCNKMNDFDQLLKEVSGGMDSLVDSKLPWKSKLHFDGTMFDNWFIAGIGTEKGKTLTYHLPMSEWDNLKVTELSKAPEWDGHTAKDVIGLLRDI